ncbi:unnamed protein product [Heterobilharzia americana]|nr:unnamed protein product [Heterobilharzia americana]
MNKNTNNNRNHIVTGSFSSRKIIKSNSHSPYSFCNNNTNNSKSHQNIKMGELKNTSPCTPGTTYNSQHRILPIVRTVYFYQDNDLDNRNSGIRLAIQPNHYRSVEALLEELTGKMSKVACNGQWMYAPKLMNKVNSMNDIHQSSYPGSSDYTLKSRGISLDRRSTNKTNRVTDYKPTPLSSSTSYNKLALHNCSSYSSKLELNNLNSSSTVLNKTANFIHLPTLDTLIVDSDDATFWRQLKQVKRIYVRLNGQPRTYKPVLIRRRYIKTLDQVLQELSELFKIPIHKVYTLEGVLIETLGEILDGPSEFVAAGLERFRPIDSIKQQSKYCSRSASRTRHSTRSPNSSVLHPLKQPYEQFSKVCSSDGGYVVCQVFIKSGQHDPQTGEVYSNTCTANPTITICNKHQSTQPILLRSAYICTLSPNNGSPPIEQNNETNGSNATSKTLPGPFCAGSIDYFEIPLNDFGEIDKIRLNHDGYGEYPEWLPEEICLRLIPNTPNTTNSSLKVCAQNSSCLDKPSNNEEESNLSSPDVPAYEILFPCMRWLSRFKADGSLVREIAAPGTQTPDQGPSFGRILKVYPLDITTLFNQEERAPGKLNEETIAILPLLKSILSLF